MPKKIKYLLIAESPPNDIRNYFYYDGPKPKQQMFFQNIIMAIYNEHCATDPVCREYLLNRFKEDSFYLIDAVEYPIPKLSDVEKREHIIDSFEEFKDKLVCFNNKNLIDENSKIILIKKLVCELLKDPLEDNE